MKVPIEYLEEWKQGKEFEATLEFMNFGRKKVNFGKCKNNEKWTLSYFKLNHIVVWMMLARKLITGFKQRCATFLAPFPAFVPQFKRLAKSDGQIL